MKETKDFNLNGIYRFYIETKIEEETATIYLINNKVYGGNNSIAILGDYEIKEDKLILTINTKIHNYGCSILILMDKMKIEFLIEKDYYMLARFIHLPIGIAEINLLKIAELED